MGCDINVLYIYMQNQIVGADDRADHSELQSSLLGVLTVSNVIFIVIQYTNMPFRTAFVVFPMTSSRLPIVS